MPVLRTLHLAAALTRLRAVQDAQQAEVLRLRLALIKAQAAIGGLERSTAAYLEQLGCLQADVARLGVECRQLEAIMTRASGNPA